MEHSYSETDVSKNWEMGAAHQAPLTSSEIANLWRLYVSYGCVKCIVEHNLNHVNDPDIRAMGEEGMSILKTRLSGAKEYLTRDGQPIPRGFTEEDVDVSAPRLFTDLYYMYYGRSISKADLLINSHALCMAPSMRRGLSVSCVRLTGEGMEYAEDGTNIMIDNGWLEEPPRMLDRSELVNRTEHRGLYYL